MAAYLEIHNLNKSYGGNPVLFDIHLEVPEGEFFVILGPSGGGKSTLLRILCGIETPDSGTIVLNGRDITRLPPRERDIGMVFQDYGLYPHMNVWENIAYGLEARGTPKHVIEERIRFAAGKLGITPLLERIVVDLSGGEQQRVALARALAKDAKLYLFDEPLSNLDPKLRVQARRDIVMVHREKHKPTLYVTHDQTEALASGDRIGILAKGRMQQIGTADDLVQRPANLYVAGFIGSPSMNLVNGTVERIASGSYQVRFGGHPEQGDRGVVVNLPDRWTPILNDHPSSAVVVGIPPTAFLLDHVTAPNEPTKRFMAVVTDADALVGEVIVTMKIPVETVVTGLFQGRDETFFTPGNMLDVAIDPEQICLFDPTSERSLM